MKEKQAEDPLYLTEQLITYIGNKRNLLGFIGQGIDLVRQRLGRDKIFTFDVFSGSGVVSRYLKAFSHRLITNDLEGYAALINRCYLSNQRELPHSDLMELYRDFSEKMAREEWQPGFIAEMYAPRDDRRIEPGERVFYTTRNAHYIDTARQEISRMPQDLQKYFLAPLLAEASVHANTAGVFKGFYKNRDTKIGHFGGKNQDALSRITKPIQLPFPVFSRFDCTYQVYQEDANQLCGQLPEVDLAYIDPPYNQHPYGSNYFMLNLIMEYRKPESLSSVSGIPKDWNRSRYNKKRAALQTLEDLVDRTKAKFLLVSFNSEGFISLEEMQTLLGRYGRVTVLETKYNTYRASRNLAGREIHVKEYLYLLEKS